MAAVRRLLAVAAATGRVGYVFLIEGKLVEWGVTGKAHKTPHSAAATLQRWINDFAPTVVVTEKLTTSTRKGTHAKRITQAFADIAAHNYVYDVAVPIIRSAKNKFAYAVSLAEVYPDLKSRLPKQHHWYDPEPRNMVIFDALALAHHVLGNPTLVLAASLDTPSDQ